MPIKDLSYTAGILDGEGSICLVKRNRSSSRGNYHIFLSVSVGNTNEWLIQWLRMQYGGNLSYWEMKHGTVMWQWQIHRKRASAFLALILPYLKIKKPQAELAIQFQARKRMGRMASGQSAIEEAEKILMQSYNGKGGLQ